MRRLQRPPAAITRLREELASRDLSLVLALGAREEAQHRLLEWKRRHALDPVDPGQEERVRRRARAWARASGGDDDLAVDVVSAAIRSGIRRFPRPTGTAAAWHETVTCYLELEGGPRAPPPDRGDRRRERVPDRPAALRGVGPPPQDAWVLPHPRAQASCVARPRRGFPAKD